MLHVVWMMYGSYVIICFLKQKTAYEMRISDWSSDVCSSDLHYQTDDALYSGFTEKTGIEINRIEAESDALIERIKSEGANSPADIFITVDAGRLWRAEGAGLFQPLESARLNHALPSSPRRPDGRWFRPSTRRRPDTSTHKT